MRSILSLYRCTKAPPTRRYVRAKREGATKCAQGSRDRGSFDLLLGTGYEFCNLAVRESRISMKFPNMLQERSRVLPSPVVDARFCNAEVGRGSGQGAEMKSQNGLEFGRVSHCSMNCSASSRVRFPRRINPDRFANGLVLQYTRKSV